MHEDNDADFRQQQQADRERIEQDLKDIIEQAQRLGLPDPQVQILKWGCGIQRRQR